MKNVVHADVFLLAAIHVYFVETWANSNGELEFYDFVKMVALKWQMTEPRAEWYARQAWR